MSDVTVIPTEYSHLDKIAEIEQKCFSNPWSKQSFADGMNNQNTQKYFTAILDDKIVGYICIFHIFEDGELLNVAVDPEYRKQGIGQTLLDKMFEYLKDTEVNRISLEVRESNISARQLYLKNGFRPTGVRKNYYSAPREDGIIMEKIL